jgi:hypothetical protein
MFEAIDRKICFRLVDAIPIASTPEPLHLAYAKSDRAGRRIRATVGHRRAAGACHGRNAETDGRLRRGRAPSRRVCVTGLISITANLAADVSVGFTAGVARL